MIFFVIISPLTALRYTPTDIIKIQTITKYDIIQAAISVTLLAHCLLISSNAKLFLV